MRLRFSLTVVLGVALSAGAAMAAAQTEQSQPSLGDVARRSREQKKPSPRPVHVWTNEDLPTTPGAISIVGTPPPPPKTTGEAAEAGAGGAGPSAEPQDRDAAIAKIEAELKDAKADLERLEKELDLAKRDLDLQNQQYYSNPGYKSDSTGKARLDAMQRDVEAKAGEVGRAKERVATLEKQLAELKSAPPAPAKPVPPQN
jgi:peptidoglycan hydrolase CwlO-like protein